MTEQRYNGRLSANAKTLRRNMTKEERHLWYDFLKPLPFMVHRQKVIGNYIVDFYIASKQIVIELDGSQHYQDEGKTADQLRDTELEALGLTVLRYSNADVNMRFESVCQDIWNKLQISDEKPSP
jgi:very-short-patch-repair endonuclease